jgi:D-sedoheptulose 7-phosphate isomerase
MFRNLIPEEAYMLRRAVFLDRDGVINPYKYNSEFGTFDSPSNPDEFSLLPDAAKAVAQVNRLGLLAIVTSNQPGVAKGKMSRDLLDAIDRKMKVSLELNGAKLDGTYYCFHHPAALLEEYRITCDCRKPKPGLLLNAARELNIDLDNSYMVGDGIVDILAGRAAATTTLFISSRKCCVCDELKVHDAVPNFIASNLSEAVERIRDIEDGKISAYGGYLPSTTADADIHKYVAEAIKILEQIDQRSIERTLELLVNLRERGGRLFILGVGGGAGHASHAACDFRKIARIEAYSASDNVSELTARVNDEGWDTSYANWLRGSRLTSADLVFVLSVGGGDAKNNVSPNLVQALKYARDVGATICGVVGRDGGFTGQVADAYVRIPVVNPSTITPHTESFQALVWHLLVSHPKLKAAEMKWESVQASQTH